MGFPPAPDSSSSQLGDSETLSSSFQDGTSEVSRSAIQTDIEVGKYWSRKLPFARGFLGGMKGSSIQLCKAWTVGSLVVMRVAITRDTITAPTVVRLTRFESNSLTDEIHYSSFIFVLTFIVKPSSMGTIPHGFISAKPVLTNNQPIGGEQKWLDDFSHSVKPRACHSHNDYLRPYPLFSALAAGCSSVEADVWLTEDGTDLLVRHDEASLAADRTLTSMYLNPLLGILDRINAGSDDTTDAAATKPRGVFRTEPNVTLVLLIDVKTPSSDTWPLVVEQLSALRDKQYLVRYENGGLEPGPLTIVGSGNIVSDYSVFTSVDTDPNRPFDEYHDTFLDAPLASSPQVTNSSQDSNSFGSISDGSGQSWTNKTAYYASASFKATIGSVITGFSSTQLSTLRAQIATAAKLGLKSRYWDTPNWPMGYRNYMWGVLEREGVGVLNVDDLEGAARGDWDLTGAVWARDTVWIIAVGAWVVCCGVAFVMLGWRRTRAVTTERVQ